MTTRTHEEAIAETRALLKQATDAVRAQATLVDQRKAPFESVQPMLAAVAVAKANLDDAYADRVGDLVGNKTYTGSPGFPAEYAGSASTVGSPGDGIGKMLADQNFNLKSNPSVELSATQVLAKANVWPGATDLSPRQPGAIIPMGKDSRWLWPHLVRQDIGSDTAIEDFKQTAVAVTGTIERAIDAVTDKAVLTTSVALVTEAVKQLAVTIDGIPNAVLESVSMLSAFLSSEGQFQIQQALDTSAMAAIVAAAPPFGTTGTTLVDKIRNGIATMRATGANPSLVVLNPSDAAGLDLLADAGGYVFPLTAAGSSSPLWNLRVVERIGVGTEPPYLLDPSMLGVLFLGTMRFDADPYTGFKKNLTTLRIETNALMHVRNSNGARRIAAT